MLLSHPLPIRRCHRPSLDRRRFRIDAVAPPDRATVSTPRRRRIDSIDVLFVPLRISPSRRLRRIDVVPGSTPSTPRQILPLRSASSEHDVSSPSLLALYAREDSWLPFLRHPPPRERHQHHRSLSQKVHLTLCVVQLKYCCSSSEDHQFVRGIPVCA